MSQDQNNLERQFSSQQQALGNVQCQGNDNIFNVIQAEIVALTQTKIIQISVDEIKTRELNPTSPYKGLMKFEPEDTDRFFGRDQFLTELVNELGQTNLILLLGASGSGKSSVIRAGLVPSLARQWGKNFVSLMLTPDSDPFESLYGVLLNRYKQFEAKIARAGEVDTLNQVVKRLKQPDAFWLIFIDQFEELFTVSDPEKRDRFIEGLVKLSKEQANNPLVKIVATMRADFLDQLDAVPANLLAGLTQKHRPLITQMEPDQLRLAIEQPAAHHGVVFEAGLVEEIIKEIHGRAGYLPLLQYTLDLLWEGEVQDGGIHDRTLNTNSYRQLGGVRGALQQRVDKIYQALSSREQQAVQRIFLRLVQIGTDETAGTEWKPFRRRADLSEFTSPQEITVLRMLIDAHLLVSGDLNATLESQRLVSQPPTVEIAHEVLLTSWTTLNDWIKQNREAIALRNRLNDDVKQWKATRSDDELWSGLKLEKVVKLRADQNFIEILGGFHPDANKFIDASMGLVTRKEQEKKQQLLKARLTAGDERKAALMKLLESCTVKLSVLGKAGSSTGFFVAPGKILTLAQEVEEVRDQPIKVCWQGQEDFAEAKICQLFPSVDLALLNLINLEDSNFNHPCVYLDKTVRPADQLCTYGYPDNFPQGGYVIGKPPKPAKRGPQVIEFETNQTALELRSSPLLNWKTLKVCGIVKSTHERDKVTPDQLDQDENLAVGAAISAATVLATVDDLKTAQKAFHKKDNRWKDLVRPIRLKPHEVVLSSLGMTILIVLIRSFQLFQVLELDFYDSLIRGRFNPPKPNDRFLIVKITRQDTEAQEKRGEAMIYSLSNVTFAKLLTKVKSLNPTAIGLDIYREQALNIQSTPKPATVVKPVAIAPEQIARQTLFHLFQEPNLFTVCKAGDEKDPEGISSSPGVTADRVGFSNLSKDGDGILRRQLLAFYNDQATHPRCPSTKSFSLVLAEHYLQVRANIKTIVEVSKNSCQIRFSNGVVLTNLKPNTGGYQGYSGSVSNSFNGCQILLNYREQKRDQEYQTVTLEEFLKPNFPAKDYNNRIVMIDIDRSDSISDNWKTPYDQGPDQVTPGVIVQAQMIEQIIDIAAKKNTLIWVLPKGVDFLLILGFALVGGGVGWWLIPLRQLWVFIVISSGAVLIITIVAFQFNGWVPLLPQFLALSATSGCIWWSNLRLKLNPTSK